MNRGQGFPRKLRLTRKSEFDRVFREGKRTGSRHFTVLYRKNPYGYPRLGSVVSRKNCGNAVRRHRVKRVLREIFRKNKEWFDSLDVVVLARRGSETLSYWEALEEMKRIAESFSTD